MAFPVSRRIILYLSICYFSLRRIIFLNRDDAENIDSLKTNVCKAKPTFVFIEIF